MSYGSIRCQVLETPAENDRRARGRDWPRDLLPWADPYIAVLMVRLQERYGDEESGDNPFDADDVPLEYALAGGWGSNDAFVPPRLDRAAKPSVPSVYGGWPLLDA